METYIALLRGINVSGQKKVPMAELRELLYKEKNLENLTTYIQTGNIIFQSSEKSEILESIIHKGIKSHFGFDVPIIVKTRNELQMIFDACPFPKEKKDNSYFIVLNTIPKRDLLKEVEAISFENEEVIIKNDALYFHSSIGYGKSKFNMNIYERKLKVTGTSRNYKTMVKLLSLSADKI